MHALTLAVLMVVSGAPEPAQPPQLKIACPGLSGVKVGDKEAVFFSEHLAQQLAAAGAKVTSDREISAVLGLERKQQLMGCPEGSTQCMTELAGALGVDALVVGDIAKLQSSYQVNVKLISVKNTELLAAESERADTDEQIVDALTTIAGRLAHRAAEKLSRSLAPQGRMGTGRSGGLPVLPIVLAGVGVVAGGFGGYAFTQADARYRQLLVVTDATQALQLKDEGITWRTATQVGLGVGAAALVGAAVTFFIGNATAAAPAVAVSTSPRGTGVVLEWRWP